MSAGSERLKSLSESNAELARQLEVTSQAVAAWRKGTSVPNFAARAKLETQFGIPASSWGAIARGPHPTPPPIPEDPPDPTSPTPPDPPQRPQPPARRPRTEGEPRASSIEECNQLLDNLRAYAGSGNFLPSELARLRDSEAKLIALRARLEREGELLEDRVVREHPAWRRIRSALLVALEPYPDAMRAVIDALQRADT